MKLLLFLTILISLVSNNLFAQELSDDYWNTLVIYRNNPSEHNFSSDLGVKKNVDSWIQELPNIKIFDIEEETGRNRDDITLINYAKSKVCDRLLIVTVTEIQKEKNETDPQLKYLVKKIPPIYSVESKLLCIDTGQKYTSAEKFSGYSYKSDKKHYLEPLLPAYSIVKEKPVVIKTNYLKIHVLSASIAYSGLVPVGSYKEYSKYGNGIQLGLGLIPFEFQYLVMSADVNYYKMNERHKKIKPYYRLDSLLGIGYLRNISDTFGIVPRISAGFVYHNIENRNIADMLYIIRMKIFWVLNKSSMLYFEPGYNIFSDNNNNGNAFQFSLGYTHSFLLN